MATIQGILNLTDIDRTFVNTVGQEVVYDAVAQYIAEHNAALAMATSFFIQQVTENFKFRYRLPGGGYLQRRGGQAQSGAVKSAGSWDVALPLEDFGVGFGGDDITLAYMTIAELQTHLETITAQNVNTKRLEILKAILDKTAYTFPDPIQGDLSVVPLANGDSVVYPPVTGSDTEATESHYFGTNYASASISDSNNPYATIRTELIEHFGGPQQGGENLAVLINSAEEVKTESLTEFVAVDDKFVNPGSTAAVLSSLPSQLPGHIIGRVSGCWVSVWDYIPAGYMVGVNLDAPKPLMERVDPASTGLPRGLSLIASVKDYPLQSAHYRNRFGLAVVNRLNGVCAQLVASTTYTTPTGYAHG
jgi:hypothetical protein